MSERDRRTGKSRDNPIGSQITPDTSDESNPLFEIISARFRMATGPLRRLPLVVSPRERTYNSRVVEMAIRPIRARAIETIKARKLASPGSYEVDISCRETEDCPETAVPTVMVVFQAFPTDNTALHKAVNDIVNFAHEIIQQDSSAPNFHVEMIDQRLVSPIYYGPVQGRSDLLYRWDRIRVLVHECLQANAGTKGRKTSTNLFHYGTDRRWNVNPITIFITVDYASKETEWPSVVDSIERALKQNGLPSLYVHIEHNLGFYCAPPFELVFPVGSDEEVELKAQSGNAVIEHDYSTQVNLGDPIGPAKYIERADGTKGYPGHGTLGCYVEVLTNNGVWEKYALTNYHVVRGAIPGFNQKLVKDKSVEIPPRDTSSLFKADWKGLPPGAHETLTAMESPPRSKHNYTLWKAQRGVAQLGADLEHLQNNPTHPNAAQRYAQIERDRTQLIEASEKKRDFFDARKQTMGRIFAASGFVAAAGTEKKTPEDGRLDWALIKVTKTRTGTNLLPGAPAWARMDVEDRPNLTFGIPLQPQRQTISREPGPLPRCWVGYKYGTTTGATRGVFHVFKPDVNITDDRYMVPPDGFESGEYSFQMNLRGIDEPFTRKGDSGSIVYDKYGCVLGLLFRGLQPKGSRYEAHGYVTPIEYIFASIKNSSNRRIVDVRIAQN